MKKILSVILILCAQYGMGQMQKIDLPGFVEIGQANNAASAAARFGYALIEGDTVYAIYFNNLQYEHITDVQYIKFRNEGGALDTLYNAFKAGFDAPNGTRTSYKLGDQDIYLITRKVPGMKSVSLTLLKNGAYFGLTRRQLSKLFNRDE